MNLHIVRAILRKDALSLLPLLALTALLHLGDAVITRLDLLPIWTMYGPAVLQVVLLVVVMAVFQLDSPASLTDDWLCRPVRVLELLAAKFILLFCATYLPSAVGTFGADLVRGFPLSAAAQDALLPNQGILPLLLLVFLFSAIVTRTFVQGFGVLIAIFVCLFVIPTPFVRPPGPFTSGIREELFMSGLDWTTLAPAKLAATVLLALGFWLTYWRRRLRAARALLAISTCVLLLVFLLPMWVLPWSTTFAVQEAVGPRLHADPAVDAADISLRNTRACFIAARRSAIWTDGAYVATSRGLGQWEGEVLDVLEPDSIAFLTHLEPRGVPMDWRVKLNFAEANYSADGTRLFTIRPANYITDIQGPGLISHNWMLPQSAVQRLRSASPQLELRYSLTLLKPRDYRVPVDGAWHALPGLGICSATSVADNRIDVECFSAFPRHAQISVQLNDIPATRVYTLADFSPAWARWPYAQNVKLTIGSSRLAPHDQGITLTAWDAADYLVESLALPGILGADTASCPLPGDATGSLKTARWRDASPHEANSIGVEGGVQLEVLDFGGTGTTIVLLPGLGATAHAFDNLAPLLAKNHRVIAITRRGAGSSTRPDFGYDTARLAQDVLAVMDQLGLERVLLVGHSIAGEELTWLGGHHPERFSGLVYLDAAYDRYTDRDTSDRRRVREIGRQLPPEPPYPPAALLNYQALSRLLEERGHLLLPEGELMASYNIDQPYTTGAPNLDVRAQQAILANVRPPDYSALKVPALAVYAIEDPAKPLPPWYDANDPKLWAMLTERGRLLWHQQHENIVRFRREVAQGRVLELPKATHNLIHSNQAEVLQAIEAFASEKR